ncbi:hypothetical protein HZB94_01365 [Candidatus Falkowbacteria bacterium]|nr:hypothetical protein [Candidatus Falkowbacteria bacterium]
MERIAAIILIIAVSACLPKEETSNQGNTCKDPCPEIEKGNPWNYECYNSGKSILNTDETTLIPPRDYGKGFYYFPGFGKRFTEELTLFLRNHSELEVVTISPDLNSAQSYQPLGYFVFFKMKSRSN